MIEKMDLERILTALIGFPLVVLLIFLGTPQVICFAIMIIAIICMNEYFTVIKKICNPIKWIGYLSTIIIFLVSIFKMETIKNGIMFGIPIITIVLFLHIIFTDMKITFKDIVYTLFGIIYITGSIMFLGLITTLNKGNFILFYVAMIAWSTDVFAYFAGKTFGKHHFSKISPKKTIEGCITGAIAATVVGIIYISVINNLGFLKIEYGIIHIGIISFLLSIISQIGDFAASTIKRFTDTKDYGNILPGHGGMLDRIDSLLFIAPYLYMAIILGNVIII